MELCLSLSVPQLCRPIIHAGVLKAIFAHLLPLAVPNTGGAELLMLIAVLGHSLHFIMILLELHLSLLDQRTLILVELAGVQTSLHVRNLGRAVVSMDGAAPPVTIAGLAHSLALLSVVTLLHPLLVLLLRVFL